MLCFKQNQFSVNKKLIKNLIFIILLLFVFTNIAQAIYYSRAKYFIGEEVVILLKGGKAEEGLVIDVISLEEATGTKHILLLKLSYKIEAINCNNIIYIKKMDMENKIINYRKRGQ